MGTEEGFWALPFCKHKDLLLLEWKRRKKKKKNSEAELSGFEGLQMQPAETL